MPTALRKLWREACGLIAWLVTAIDRPALPTTGISRESGAKVSIWLMNIEAAVRRLIFAAALQFTLPTPRTIACARAPVARKQPETRRPGFRVFRLAASGAAPPAIPTQLAQPAPPQPIKRYGHVPFPSDPLLSLGQPSHATTPQTPPITGPRPLNPLDRWVRPSRRDPDWRPTKDPDAMFVDPADRPPTPERQRTRRARPERTPHDPNALDISLYDWRRRHDEWQKLIPAPDLAARLDALERITQDPRSAITSAARRLARSRAATTHLARSATPRIRIPRRAAHLDTPHRRLNLPGRCHAQILHADTS